MSREDVAVLLLPRYAGPTQAGRLPDVPHGNVRSGSPRLEDCEPAQPPGTGKRVAGQPVHGPNVALTGAATGGTFARERNLVMAKYPMKDLVVILPGITGSVLNDGADAVWGLSTGALWQFVKSRGHSLQRLEVPQHDPREGAPAGDVRATALVNGFHGVFGLAKIDGYGPLVAALQQRFQVTPGGWDDDHPANLVAFPYDWRLSNRASARRLGEGIDQKLARWRAHSGAGDAKVILIAHSMGGLVSRYWIEVLQGWRECRALVSFGTPYRGSLDAVGYLANGYKKAFVDLTSVLLSCPSVYELLPVYRAVQRGDEWFRPHEVELPVVDPARHALAQDYVAAAAEFHREIREAVEQNRSDPQYLGACTVVPFVGVHQTTGQSAVLDGDRLTVSDAVPSWFEDDVGGGDGTVPRVSARRSRWTPRSGRPTWPPSTGPCTRSGTGSTTSWSGCASPRPSTWARFRAASVRRAAPSTSWSTTSTSRRSRSSCAGGVSTPTTSRPALRCGPWSSPTALAPPRSSSCTPPATATTRPGWKAWPPVATASRCSSPRARRRWPCRCTISSRSAGRGGVVSWPVWPKGNEKALAGYAVAETANGVRLTSSTADALAAGDLRSVVAELYDEFATMGIRWSREMYQPEQAVQEVRPPDSIVGGAGDGTCLDVALLFAGAALGKELLPVVVVLDGHALVAVSLRTLRRGADSFARSQSEGGVFTEGVLSGDDACARLAALVDRGEYVMVECTGFARSEVALDSAVPEGQQRTEGLMDFARAVTAGREQLDFAARPFVFAVDVAYLQDVVRVERYTPVGAATSQPSADLRQRHRTMLEDYDLVAGRDPELERLDDFLTEQSSGYLLVTGDPGVGKTALMAEWLRRLDSRTELRTVYYFLNRQYGTAARQFDFMQSLLQQATAAWGRTTRAVDTVAHMEADWRSLLDVSRPPSRPVVVIIDGADEADGWTINQALFPRHLPEGSTSSSRPARSSASTGRPRWGCATPRSSGSRHWGRTLPWRSSSGSALPRGCASTTRSRRARSPRRATPSTCGSSSTRSTPGRSPPWTTCASSPRDSTPTSRSGGARSSRPPRSRRSSA